MGTSIEIPCEPGDVVYCVSEKKSKHRPYIVKGHVDSLLITRKGEYIRVNPDYLDRNVEKWDWQGGKFAFSSFGKSVFFERNDAERYLSKL